MKSEDTPNVALVRMALNRIDALEQNLNRSVMRGRLKMEVEQDLVIAENHAAQILEFVKTARRIER